MDMIMALTHAKGDECMKHKLITSLLIAILYVSYTMPVSYAQLNDKEQPSANDHKIAIVIDDLGNDMEGTEAILAINAPLTVAVMPFLQSSQRDAELAHAAGHEVIVHLPMEPNRGLKRWLGPGAITSDLTDEQVRERVEAAIAQVPYATGINNHMGSKITANERIMRIILQVCKEHNLFYLDSKTTDKSVVPKLAKELGVPYVENALFLDDQYTATHVHKQMQKVYQLIKFNETTIIIGHVGMPGKYTSAELARHIPKLMQQCQLVYLSELVRASLIDPEVM